MCGICGFIGFNDNKLLKKMTNILKHRGPDDKGYYTDNNISLGHTRLSIIDLSKKGKQPLSNEDGDIWITFNGEVYNYIELKDELQKKGHKFSSKTDTETIVHAYEEYGLDFVKKLNGMFAFAIWDSKNNKIILARDPIGQKPLYYYFNGTDFIFASEIKSILEAKIKREVDKNALRSFLAFQYTIGEQTMFKGIKKVMGGQMLILDIKKNKIDKKTIQYWDIKEKVVNKSEKYFKNKLKNLLEESSKLTVRSDVPVGVFLSGGIDSSIVAAFAKNKINYNFHAFSMDFETNSELEYANIMAKHLDTVHHKITMDEKSIIKNMQKITWHFDEPIGDPAIIANYFLSKYAKKYVKVVLAGDGGDELFAGYKTYITNLKYLKLFNLPHISRQFFGNILNNFSCRTDYWKKRNVRRFLYFSQKDITDAHLYSTRGINEWEMRWLEKNKKPYDVYSNAIKPKNIRQPLNYLQILDCKNFLPEKFLMKSDKTTMAHGVEERLILLDKKIIDFSFSIPPELKIKNGQEKYILRMAAEQKVPTKILWRKKRGFGVPIKEWLNEEMKDYAIQKLDGGFLKKEFNQDTIRNISKHLKNDKIEYLHQSSIIWSLITLEEWHEQFFS